MGDEDNKQKDRISAKNGLESYCFNMKTTIEDEKMADKISEDDKKKITDKCDDAIKWLDANQLAEVEEFQEKQKEVEAVCNPIIAKLYQSAGGAGMPDMSVCQEACPALAALPPPAELAPAPDPPSRRSTKCSVNATSIVSLFICNLQSIAFVRHFN